jgi:hypothetical protein
MRIHRLALAFAVLGALAVGCAGSPLTDSQYMFNESQRHYTQFVRWARFDEAANYLEPETRDAYLEQASQLGDVRFTDYKVRNTTFDDGGRSATVRVTYYAYVRTQLVAIAFDEEQRWTKQGVGGGTWKLRSSMAQRPIQPEEIF